MPPPSGWTSISPSAWAENRKIDVSRKSGNLFVLSAPSGGGKSTVTQALLASDPSIRYSISCTTRERRGDEVDGKDYFYMSEEEFEHRIADGDFLEYARVHGHLYGTRRSWIDEQMEKCRDVVLDIDVQGSLDIKRQLLTAVLIFILPPDFDVLEKRLRGRGTDSDAVIAHRLDNAQREVLYAGQYDYVVVNEDLADTTRAIQEIIAVERRRGQRLNIEVAGRVIPI